VTNLWRETRLCTQNATNARGKEAPHTHGSIGSRSDRFFLLDIELVLLLELILALVGPGLVVNTVFAQQLLQVGLKETRTRNRKNRPRKSE
jgi:hypothetical protein